MIKSFYTESRRVVTLIIECSYVRLSSMKRTAPGKPVGVMNQYNWIRAAGPQDDVSISARLQYFDQIMRGMRESSCESGIDKILKFYGDTVFWIDDNLYHSAKGVGVVHPFCTVVDEKLWEIRAFDYIDEFTICCPPCGQDS